MTRGIRYIYINSYDTLWELESVYETFLAKALEERGLHVERQVPVTIVYDGIRFEEGFRADIIVEIKVCRNNDPCIS